MDERRDEQEHVTVAHFNRVVGAINRRLDKMASSQADADALVAQLQQDEVDLGQVAADVVAGAAAIQATIDAAVAQNPGIDLSAAQAEADKLSQTVAPLDASIKALPGNTQPAAGGGTAGA